MSLPPATAFSGYEMFFIQKIHTRLEALVKLISTGISAYSFSFLNLYEKTFKNNVTTIYSGDVIFKNRNTIHLETQIQNKKQRNILLSSLCKREFQDKTVLG